MMQLKEVLTQDIINRMFKLMEGREKDRDFASYRSMHNKQVHDLINELSDGEE